MAKLPITSSPASRPLRARLVVLASGLMLLGGCADLPPVRALRIAAHASAHTLCSAVFVSGRDLVRTDAEELQSEGGRWLLRGQIEVEIDRERHEVRAQLPGLPAARSVFHGGQGCRLVHGATSDAPPAAPLRPVPPGEPARTAADARIAAAIDAAFIEAGTGTPRQTRAVVVMHRGQLVGERYAGDLGPQTLWHTRSVAKSMLHALSGVAIRQGRLSLDDTVTVAGAASSPGHTVTVDQLLRMTGGDHPFEPYSGFDEATQMWSLQADMAGWAAARPHLVPPGTRWNYSDTGYLLASRRLQLALSLWHDDLVQWAHRELFDPAGIGPVVMEFDGAGTTVGSSHFYVTARGMARFGQLYLDDGVVAGRRLLPEGWVAHARHPTLDAAYGAGFWLNHRHDLNSMGIPWGLPGAPDDAYFARGYLGQFVVIVPSRQLVVVRLGLAHARGGDAEGVGRLVQQIVAALDAPAP